MSGSLRRGEAAPGRSIPPPPTPALNRAAPWAHHGTGVVRGARPEPRGLLRPSRDPAAPSAPPPQPAGPPLHPRPLPRSPPPPPPPGVSACRQPQQPGPGTDKQVTGKPRARVAASGPESAARGAASRPGPPARRRGPGPARRCSTLARGQRAAPTRQAPCLPGCSGAGGRAGGRAARPARSAERPASHGYSNRSRVAGEVLPSRADGLRQDVGRHQDGGAHPAPRARHPGGAAG